MQRHRTATQVPASVTFGTVFDETGPLDLFLQDPPVPAFVQVQGLILSFQYLRLYKYRA